MPFILPGNVASATAAAAYSIDNSVRFNTDASFNKTSSSDAPTLATKSTISFWVKMCSFGVSPTQNVIYTNGAVSPYFQMQWPGNTGAGPVPYVQNYASSNTLLYGNQNIRDPAAWYHVVFSYDSTPSTPDASSMRLFINGTQVTSLQTATYGSQDVASALTQASQAIYVGANANGSAVFMDGYLAELMVVDGQALAATDFGEFDSDSPTIWKPIDISGITLGTQGFWLDFKDSANMGNDAGGGTDFTENSIDATDQATDTPTNNFCTMNPLGNYWEDAAFAQGNCKITTKGSTYAYTTGTIGLTAGKWYWEVEVDSQSSLDFADIGIASRLPNSAIDWLGLSSTSWGIYAGGDGYANNGSTTAWCDNFTDGDIISIALDIDNDKMYAAKNGSWSDGTNFGESDIGDADGIDITAVASTEGRAWFPAVGYNEGGSSYAVFLCNFGGCSAFTVSSANQDENGYGNFEYAVPSGYLAICTKNLGSDGG